VQYKRFGLIAAAAAAATLVFSGCTSTGGETQASAATSTPAATTSATVDVQAHNDADVAFATGMIPHHQQAIEMSDMLLAKRDIDPQVVSLANDIKAAQGPEIEQMQGWLTQWGTAMTPSPTSAMPGHDMPGHDMPGHDMTGMSGGQGMMSQADMTALQNAQGAEASRLFLTQMIEHHKGAITMAQAEIDGGQFPAAVQMARSIVTSQRQEITTMQGLLDSM
jgi:uncharacterized protein (DUF305 family)